jgi:hypothetical protein
VPVERAAMGRGERRLAYTAGAVFVALGLAAAALWLHEGQLVYVEQVLSGLANCL